MSAVRARLRRSLSAALLLFVFVAIGGAIVVATVVGARNGDPLLLFAGVVGLVGLFVGAGLFAVRRRTRIGAALRRVPVLMRWEAAMHARRAIRVDARVRDLLDRGRPLDAAALALARQAYPLEHKLMRQLAREVQAWGYLRQARRLLAIVAERRGADSDVVALDRIDGTIALLRGKRLPSIRSERLDGLVESRVLHVVKRDLLDAQAGYTLRTHLTAAAQSAAGLDVHVVSQLGVSSSEPSGGSWSRDGVTYHRLAGASISELRQDEWFRLHVAALAELVRELRPQVLHAASDFVNARAARIVGAAFDIPVVYEVRGFWDETLISQLSRRNGWAVSRLRRRHGLPEAYLWRRESEAFERNHASRVVTLAPIMADKIVAEGAAVDRITIVPNAVDSEALTPLSRDRALLRRLGFREDTTVMGYVSTLSEYEGIDVLIRAFAAMRARRREGGVGLLIVGEGTDRARLEAVADEVGRAGIVFAGSVPHEEVRAYYSILDVFVVPRQPDEVCRLVTPLKVYEAFALSRAVVMSDVEALAAIAEESDAAVLARAGDPRSLARVISRLMDDDEGRLAMARRGREWVSRERTWDANARIYRELYRELTANQAARVVGVP